MNTTIPSPATQEKQTLGRPECFSPPRGAEPAHEGPKGALWLAKAIRPASRMADDVCRRPGGTLYEIRYTSLFNEGRALAFPCDAAGHVELDALSDRARDNYLYARAVVGREYAAPAVRVCELH